MACRKGTTYIMWSGYNSVNECLLGCSRINDTESLNTDRVDPTQSEYRIASLALLIILTVEQILM